MESPGGKPRRVRERLNLTYRDGQRASREIATRRSNFRFPNLAEPRSRRPPFAEGAFRHTSWPASS